MLASLALLLGLPLALAAEAPSCTPLVPVTFENSSLPQIQGLWIYIAGASKYPPHLEELKGLKYAAFIISQGNHEDELNVTEIMRVNETCVVKNSKIQVVRHNSTLVHVSEEVNSMAKLIQSDKDALILNIVHDEYAGLSISARTSNVSKEQMEEFKAQMHCLGFTEEEMFFMSEKDACPLPEEMTEDGDTEKQQVE
ncbi:alpha-1-acid glycoprotein-like [Phaenicophaeus curvirostris]|uniref:alpha-1-acid glycoprotein-like n=1 Tax=Phaenicophaeus curvirostris TaxID=33595 RepID=UPI0037F0A40F